MWAYVKAWNCTQEMERIIICQNQTYMTWTSRSLYMRKLQNPDQMTRELQNNFREDGSAETAHWLREPNAAAEEPNSVPRTNAGQFTSPCNSNSRRHNTLFLIQQPFAHPCTYAHTDTHIYKIKNKDNNFKKSPKRRSMEAIDNFGEEKFLQET